MVVGQARCIELLSYQAGYAEVSTAIQGLARGYLLLASEMDPTREPGDDGEHPKPDSTNPAQAPKLVNGLNCQRVLAAQAGIEAYLFEEVHGLDHPIARILRLLEQYPLQVGTILSRYRVEIEASFANGVPTIEYLISLAEKVARQLPATLQSEYRQGVRI